MSCLLGALPHRRTPLLVRCPPRHLPERSHHRGASVKKAKIPFLKWFRKQMGKGYDTFEAFGATFKILYVMEVTLKNIIPEWKREGCTNEQDFIDVWKSIHPRRKFDLEEYFWVHCFEKIEEGSGQK